MMHIFLILIIELTLLPLLIHNSLPVLQKLPFTETKKNFYQSWTSQEKGRIMSRRQIIRSITTYKQLYRFGYYLIGREIQVQYRNGPTHHLFSLENCEAKVHMSENGYRGREEPLAGIHHSRAFLILEGARPVLVLTEDLVWRVSRMR